ncbi:hypothetical protein AAMO2058_000895000 [Amorphochlora amoebiformis]
MGVPWGVVFGAFAVPILLGVGVEMMRPSFKVHSEGAILITGATSGIGKYTADHLADLGYTVFVGARSEEKAEAVRDKNIENVIPIVLDVTHDGTVREARAQVELTLRSKNMKLIGVVNNAGISTGGTKDLVEETRAVFDVNSLGVLRVSEAFKGLITESQGRIVNIGSLNGIWSVSIPYCSSKFALEAITDSQRLHYSRLNVSVSIVQPGYVKTNMCSHDFCGDAKDTIEAISHALLSPRPQTRYTTATVFGYPSWLLGFIGYHAPDIVKDGILRAFGV